MAAVFGIQLSEQLFGALGAVMALHVAQVLPDVCGVEIGDLGDQRLDVVVVGLSKGVVGAAGRPNLTQLTASRIWPKTNQRYQ